MNRHSFSGTSATAGKPLEESPLTTVTIQGQEFRPGSDRFRQPATRLLAKLRARYLDTVTTRTEWHPNPARQLPPCGGAW